MTAIGYAYPWDLDGTDPAALGRIAQTGVTGVAVAASYHGTRAATPEHPLRRLVEATHSACYVPVRHQVWAGRRLVPSPPGWAAPDSAVDARARLGDTGLDAHMWIVLTHDDLLGRSAPDLCVRNAFGETYGYALCPSASDVAEYCRTLVHEIVVQTEPDGVVLEACGPFGVEHGGEHDKTDFADWTPLERELLSLCFCDACRVGHRDAGLDPDEVAASVRSVLTPGHLPVLDLDVVDEVQRLRAAATGRLLADIVADVRALRGTTRVTAHASAQPGAVGSFPFLDADSAALVDTVVASCWATPTENVAALSALAGRRPAPQRVGGYVRPDTAPSVSAADLVMRYREAGLDEVHLYHLGLVGAAGRARLTEYANA